MGTTMIPLLKDKVDELFLHWFSEIETQNVLRKELEQIRASNGTAIPPPLTLTPLAQTPNSVTNSNMNNRPSSPPVPPGSPTSTPRSPRRRTSSDLSRKGSRKSLRQKVHEEKNKQIYPGCAKNIKQFYFPFGEPKIVVDEEKLLADVQSYFDKQKNNVVTLDGFKNLMKVRQRF